MISSMLEPASRFSKTVATGIRVSRNTQAPLRLSGTLSTAGQFDQSRLAILELLTFRVRQNYGKTAAGAISKNACGEGFNRQQRVHAAHPFEGVGHVEHVRLAARPAAAGVEIDRPPLIDEAPAHHVRLLADRKSIV